MRHAVHRPRQLRVLRRPTGWGAVRESIHEPAVRGTPPQHAPLVGEHPMIDVLPGTDRRPTDLYIDLPFRRYRHDPLWVPPLRADIRKLMSPKKNPLFAEAAIEPFVAFNEAGVVVGRISATIHHDYNSRFGEQHVFFGYFECENSQEVADALVAAVSTWALQRGKTSLIGPY